MNPPSITLTHGQEDRAVEVGIRRRRTGRDFNHTGNRHFNASGWGADIEGACAEFAVSLWSGLPWTGEHEFTPPFLAPDVGDDIEVRQTGFKVRKYGEPVLRIDQKDLADKGARRFVLAHGWAPRFVICGWAYPEEAQQDEWATVWPERTTWDMPASRLHAPAELLSQMTLMP